MVVLEIPGNELIAHGKDDFLGSGSFGSVYRCYNHGLGEVATKWVKLTGSWQIIQNVKSKVKEEIEMLDQIERERQHQGIARVLSFFGMFESNEGVGLVMEYASRGDLNALMFLADVPWEIRLRIMTQVAEGMSYLHEYCFGSERRMTHNDLKPHNILLDENFGVKICDFGGSNIASYTNDLTLAERDSNFKVHTMLYAAPEFLADMMLRRTRAMDVYSFAMVTCYVVTRRHPFCPYLNGVKDKILNGIKPLHNAEGIKEESDKKDHGIINALFEVMSRCGSFLRDDRPLIKEVWASLQSDMDNVDAKSIHQLIEKLKSIVPEKPPCANSERSPLPEVLGVKVY